MDIVDRLKKWLEKDQVIARNWDENGFSIDGDIELAIEEIERLRHLTSHSSRAAGTVCPTCGSDDITWTEFECNKCDL